MVKKNVKQQYVYRTRESLNGVQDYLNDVEKVLNNKDIDANSADKISWSSDSMRKAVIGISTVAGVGGAVAAGTGAAAGAAGAGGALAGGAAVESLVGGAAAAGGAAAGSLVVPALVAAIPILLAVVGIIIALSLHGKNKEEKERLMNEMSLYKEAVKKQNDLVREIKSLKSRIDKDEAKYNDLYARYQLLSEVNKKLMDYIRNLESDLNAARAMA